MRLPSEGATGWNASEERLLCLVVLQDRYATYLSDQAGDAFFRAFIVQDRPAGRARMRFRFRYKTGTNWFGIEGSQEWNAAHALQEFKDGIESIMRSAADAMGRPLPANAIVFFEPPDDHGDLEHTIKWLLERDLIEIKEVIEVPKGEPS